MIYEDVQRDSAPVDADNGWSSSEFESYDEQSDNETKLPTRSKVVMLGVCVCARVCMCMHARCVCLAHTNHPLCLF